MAPLEPLRLTKLKTFVASPRSWNLTFSNKLKSRRMARSTSRDPGPMYPLRCEVESEKAGPTPGHVLGLASV